MLANANIGGTSILDIKVQHTHVKIPNSDEIW